MPRPLSAAARFPRAVMHVPIETARDACEEARRLGADCPIAIGGGSTTGLGKAIALDSGLPILAIPTTYAGSEMTPIYGITEAGLKKAGKDARVLPRTVIYDPELTLSLPDATRERGPMTEASAKTLGLALHRFAAACDGDAAALPCAEQATDHPCMPQWSSGTRSTPMRPAKSCRCA